MLQHYFKNLYRRTMDEAYGLAFEQITQAIHEDGSVLDCGANTGGSFHRLQRQINLDTSRYQGIEWNQGCVDQAQAKGLNIIQGDLNRQLPFDNDSFRCVFALSVLEHLLNPCAFMRECHRVLEPQGTLVLLTPNISTLFTIALLIVGKMPSSGPHPDSNALLAGEELFKVSSPNLLPDTESETPVHRHLVVFSYRVLHRYLNMLGFTDIKGYGFGLYPFPNFLQHILEKLDPYHCHQMVFIAEK
ncbi:class I SAM-dependent methyltransferase [Magnetovirga frankeli]|uniref:class I SAM-dependent methyltransferase n=1 Tax=Magnetovirga frankeli TaxID=947516 RepID=UPI001292E8A9|nr:class I SAM-dependent methyltransferase [gamma proteobacterium SS-5]